MVKESIAQVVGYYGLRFLLNLPNVGERLGAITLRIFGNFLENDKERELVACYTACLGGFV